jgi:hypothetical protein
MMRVFCSEAASEAPRFTAVVVLPTPPFWLAMEITRAKCQFPQTRREFIRRELSMQDVSRGTSRNGERKMFHVEHNPLFFRTHNAADQKETP